MNFKRLWNTVEKSARAPVSVLVLCLIVMATMPTARAETEYSFGVVPQFEPRKLARIWRPILEELEKITGLKFKMVGSPKIPDFEKSFTRGAFDFAYMNPYHAMLAAKAKSYTPLVRDGGRQLFGILVVRKEDPIKSVTELESGSQIAFPAPNALGASLLMRADLKTRFNLNFEPVYVQTHSSVYLNVALKRMRAGGGVMASLNGQKESVRSQLRVLYKTDPLPPHPVVGHFRVPEHHRELVRQAFFMLAQTAEGRAMLSAIPINQVAAASIEDYLALAERELDKFYVKN